MCCPQRFYGPAAGCPTKAEHFKDWLYAEEQAVELWDFFKDHYAGREPLVAISTWRCSYDYLKSAACAGAGVASRTELPWHLLEARLNSVRDETWYSRQMSAQKGRSQWQRFTTHECGQTLSCKVPIVSKDFPCPGWPQREISMHRYQNFFHAPVAKLFHLGLGLGLGAPVAQLFYAPVAQLFGFGCTGSTTFWVWVHR